MQQRRWYRKRSYFWYIKHNPQITFSEQYLSRTRGMQWGTQKTFLRIELFMIISKTLFSCNYKRIEYVWFRYLNLWKTWANMNFLLEMGGSQEWGDGKLHNYIIDRGVLTPLYCLPSFSKIFQLPTPSLPCHFQPLPPPFFLLSCFCGWMGDHTTFGVLF